MIQSDPIRNQFDPKMDPNANVTRMWPHIMHVDIVDIIIVKLKFKDLS